MKLALLVNANLCVCPFVNIYTNVLDKFGIKYDVVCFDKRGIDESATYHYSHLMSDQDNQLKKLYGYCKYVYFLKKLMHREKYDKLIVFGPQITMLLYPFLKKYYKGKFIIDYRDLSIEQKFPRWFHKAQKIAAFNMISSEGFKSVLARDINYIVSHNFNINMLDKAIAEGEKSEYSLMPKDGVIKVLTIGQLRDWEANREMMLALANDNRFKVYFRGRGIAEPLLREEIIKKELTNVEVTGWYTKEEEPVLIETATMLNIFMQRGVTHDTLMSNRFYNSLIFRKPMITTKYSIQGEFVEKYKVGINIENTNNLADKLYEYISCFDSKSYEKNRLLLLNKFKNDYMRFEEAIKIFVLNKML